MRRPSAFSFILACGLWAMLSIAQTRPALLPVPKPGPQALAERKIKQKYAKEYAQKDGPSRLALAHTLRTAAKDLKANPQADDDAPMRYVMLREARELAVDAGDFQFALRCIDDLAADFAINALEMKMSALSAGLDKAALPPSPLADAYMKVADDFMNAGDFDSARRAMVLAHNCQRSAPNDVALKQRVNDYDKRLNAATREMRDMVVAAQKLRKSPDDPALNQTVGQYLCSVGGWDMGLPMLVKGTDRPLADLAAKDLANPTDAVAMADLADAWWAGDAAKPINPWQAKRRAVYWYGRALPNLSGERASIAQKRIDEVE
ncbi:MAG TPA: hypothetical protein VH370_02995 [Humisphaera sp.]|nr:hypothetical protein [Humisphaera sp.]